MRIPKRDGAERHDAIEILAAGRIPYGASSRTREEQRQRVVVRHTIAADTGKRLRERAHDEVDLVENALRFGAAQPSGAERAERVRLIDEEKRAGVAAGPASRPATSSLAPACAWRYDSSRWAAARASGGELAPARTEVSAIRVVNRSS